MIGFGALAPRISYYTYRHLSFNWQRSLLPLLTIATGTLLVYLVLAVTDMVRAQLTQMQGTLSAAAVQDASRAVFFIALIALLVGALETAIVMTRSVLGRIHEVGLLKATGIRNEVIASLFLVEAGLYGLGGGLVGVALGWAAAGILQALSGVVAWQIDWGAATLGLVLAPLVSLASAALPIWRVMRLSAIQAIYYQF